MLKSSAALEKSLLRFLELRPANASKRVRSSRIMCSVAFEHAESAKILLAAGNFTSAIGLVRLQYEAFVRAMWLLYAASDTAVAKLTAELTEEGAKQAENLPMVTEMLKKLDTRAPSEFKEALFDFREYSWKPLSSYVHGGIHAIHRHSRGYPVGLLRQVLKASNGLSTMIAMLLIVLSGDKMQLIKIARLQTRFADCLPAVKGDVE